MKKLRFEYSTELLFEGSVTEHCFTLRCVPISDGRQLVAEPKCEILPHGGSIWSSRDSFGNSLLCGRIVYGHESFSFHVTGEAEMIASDIISGTASPVYGYFSPLTAPGESILKLREKLLPQINSTENILQKASVISEGVYANMNYQKGVTGVYTAAEEAMKKGGGVCQDYTHIFLSLCRVFGIRCRYVSGLACENGETHAWAEVNDGEKWYGIDPANNRSINENYIKICHGRDYADCPIERGVYMGSCGSSQKIFSLVKERSQ